MSNLPLTPEKNSRPIVCEESDKEKNRTSRRYNKSYVFISFVLTIILLGLIGYNLYQF